MNQLAIIEARLGARFQAQDVSLLASAFGCSKEEIVTMMAEIDAGQLVAIEEHEKTPEDRAFEARILARLRDRS